MAARSWEGVELPILEEVVAAHQEGREAPDTNSLVERTGLDVGRVVGAARHVVAFGTRRGHRCQHHGRQSTICRFAR